MAKDKVFKCMLKPNSSLEKLKECIHPLCNYCHYYKKVKKIAK